MNSNRSIASASRLSFYRLVWLFPITHVLHVLEELPGFTAWAMRYASPSFTTRDYLTIHLTGIVVAVAAPLAISYFSNRFVVFVFFTFVFTPAAFFNILFHTVRFGLLAATNCQALSRTADTVLPGAALFTFGDSLANKRRAL